MKKTNVIELKPLGNKFMEVTIVGDSDLVLNKMNDINARMLTDKQKGKAKNTETPNEWEGIITSMHWLKGKPTNYSEEGLIEALKEKASRLENMQMDSSVAEGGG